MTRLDLSDEERQVLTQVLESALQDLRWEIRRTDHRGYREMLRKRDDVLTTILEQVGPAAVR